MPVGFLSDADLELTATGVVVRHGLGDAGEGIATLGVVHLEGAGKMRSASPTVPDHASVKKTYFLLKSS